MASKNLPDVVLGNGAIVQPQDASDVLNHLVEQLPVLDEEDLTPRTLARIMNATGASDIFANPEMENLQDNLGRILILENVIGRRRSDYEGSEFFLVYEVTDPDSGERFSIGSASPYAATSALVAQHRGMLPATVRIVGLESRKKPGQVSTWFVFTRPAARRAETGEIQE
jgi:hypothetical protein